VQIKTALQFVPTIHAKFNLIDNLLAIQFGMDGNAEYPSYRNAVNINPFLYGWELMNGLFYPQLHREYYLGLNTELSKTLDFAVKGQLVSYKNLLNFDVDNNERLGQKHLFLAPYLGATFQDINCLQLQADLNYHLDEKIAVSAMGRLNSYDDDILYKPKFEADLTARYNMQDKIILKTQLYFASGIYYRNNLAIVEQYNLKADWSIDVEFRFNRRCSAFMEFNNLLGQRSELWYNYGTYKMNFLTGVTFSL
jgi:hypothetical protein